MNYDINTENVTSIPGVYHTDYYYKDEGFKFESFEHYVVDYDEIRTIDDVTGLIQILIQALGGGDTRRTIVSIQPSKFDVEKYHFLKKMVDDKK